jgi:hypothetical protein
VPLLGILAGHGGGAHWEMPSGWNPFAPINPDNWWIGGLPIDKRWTRQMIIDYVRDHCGKDCVTPIERLFQEADRARPKEWRMFQCCNRFTDELQNATPNTKCYTTEVVIWASPIGLEKSWCFAHYALKVTLCDGTVFYIDDAWLGGIGNEPDRIFGEDDIPWYYKPPDYWYPDRPPLQYK